jgi:hypothetical protein
VSEGGREGWSERGRRGERKGETSSSGCRGPWARRAAGVVDAETVFWLAGVPLLVLFCLFLAGDSGIYGVSLGA